MKLKYIRKTTAILHEELGGVVPGTLEGLLAFPGVGPKMALIVLNAAFGRQDGVAIDTHLHRMLNQLGWTTGCKQPEQTRRQLEAWLPRDVWGDINLIWVGVGQELAAIDAAAHDPDAVDEGGPGHGVGEGEGGAGGEAGDGVAGGRGREGG